MLRVLADAINNPDVSLDPEESRLALTHQILLIEEMVE